MYQTNCIYIGFQLILNMLTYVTPSSDRYSVKIESQEWNFGSLQSQRIFTTQNYDVNYLQLLVLGVDMHVYN